MSVKVNDQGRTMGTDTCRCTPVFLDGARPLEMCQILNIGKIKISPLPCIHNP